MGDSVKSNELDAEIREKKTLIEKLEKEITRLAIEKAKQNTNYIGRVFEMKGLEYMYVNKEWGGTLYGISFQDFECMNSMEVRRSCRFNPDDIEKELDIDIFKKKLKDMIGWNEVKGLLSE